MRVRLTKDGVQMFAAAMMALSVGFISGYYTAPTPPKEDCPAVEAKKREGEFGVYVNNPIYWHTLSCTLGRADGAAPTEYHIAWGKTLALVSDNFGSVACHLVSVPEE